MLAQLAVLSCAIVAALAAYNGPLAGGSPASLYPAGISPHACPNFPHCTNPALAANPNAPAPPAQYQVPNYQQGVYSNQPGYDNTANNAALNSGVYTGDGDYHGEGLKESGAFGDISHSFNSEPAPNQAPEHYNVVPYAHAQPAAVPAGVNPHSCPNYPYCQ